MSANIEQIKAMLERAGKTNLLQEKKVDLDKERLQLEEAAEEYLQKEPDVDLDALVDEAFDKYSSVDGYGQLVVSFNRAELYSFIKEIARKEK